MYVSALISTYFVTVQMRLLTVSLAFGREDLIPLHMGLPKLLGKEKHAISSSAIFMQSTVFSLLDAAKSPTVHLLQAVLVQQMQL